MYCKKCGKEIEEGVAYCPYCGAKQTSESGDIEVVVRAKKRNDTLAQVGLVFCIVGTVIAGFALIPLAWCLPMTISINNKLQEKKEISIALKVCTLLFVSFIGGLLLLLADELED